MRTMFGRTVRLILDFGIMALFLVVWFRLMRRVVEWRSRLFEKRYRLQTLFGSDDEKLK